MLVLQRRRVKGGEKHLCWLQTGHPPNYVQQSWVYTYCFKKKSRNGDTLGPVEMIV